MEKALSELVHRLNLQHEYPKRYKKLGKMIDKQLRKDPDGIREILNRLDEAIKQEDDAFYTIGNRSTWVGIMSPCADTSASVGLESNKFDERRRELFGIVSDFKDDKRLAASLVYVETKRMDNPRNFIYLASWCGLSSALLNS